MFDPQIPNPHLMLIMGEARQSDVLKEAKRDQLVRKAKPPRPRLANRVLAGVGGCLISAGTKLQEQYT
jgi:hypothetical protein